MTYEPNVWAFRPWANGPGLALFSHPLTKQPAVFVTVGSMSHSILVPQMHPASRWSNIGGQLDLVPGMREYGQLQELLSSHLPKYGVVQAAKQVMTDDRQPIEAAWAVMRRVFAQQGLAPTMRPCIFLRADLGGLPFHLRALHEMERGFWFCELEKVQRASKDAEGWQSPAPEFDDVFAQIERRCPRYFPAGNAVTRSFGEGVARFYSRSDTSLSINHAGAVYFKNMRALNPTELGMVDAIRAGRFQLDCDRLPGRYLPPWSRGWGVDLE